MSNSKKITWQVRALDACDIKKHDVLTVLGGVLLACLPLSTSAATDSPLSFKGRLEPILHPTPTQRGMADYVVTSTDADTRSSPRINLNLTEER